MIDRRWRIELGIVAVASWSVLVGFPVLTFHLRSEGLLLGEHLHAAILFIGSEFLVFWMAARPRLSKKEAYKPEMPVTGGLILPASQPFSGQTPQGTKFSYAGTVDASQLDAEEVWDAELARPDADRLNRTQGNDGSVRNQFGVQLTVTNYVGSSRTRRVTIEPGGAHQLLMPGQSMRISATGRGAVPSFRIVESDLTTQVFIEGQTSDVSTNIDNQVAGPSPFQTSVSQG